VCKITALFCIALVTFAFAFTTPLSFASHADPDGETPDPPPGGGGGGGPSCKEWSPPMCSINEAGDPVYDPPVCVKGDPVYLFDGSFFYRHNDLVISGKIPIVINRTYDTRIEFKGLFGYGWSMGYHVRLFTLSNGNILLKNGDNTKTEYITAGSEIYTEKDGYKKVTSNDNGSFTLDWLNGYYYEFDINGCLEKIREKNGNQLLFTYLESDGNKVLVPFSGVSEYALVDTPITLGYDYQLLRIDAAHNDVPTGRYVEFTYNSNGRIEKIEDFEHRQVLYTYSSDQRGDLIQMVDPEGNAYDYEYDENHWMTSFVGLGCNDCTLHTNIYNENGQVIRQEHGNEIIEFEYLPDYNTKLTTYIYNDQTLELLNTRYEYYDFDADGYTTKRTRQVGAELDEDPGSTEDNDVVFEYTYDTNKKLIQKINPNGVQTDYTYDSTTGNLLTETVNIPGGSDTVTTTYTYDPTHNKYDSVTISSTLETQSYRTEYTYDSNGNIATESTFADSSDPGTAMTTNYTYDDYGKVLTITDPMDNVISHEYDGNGFLSRTYDPANPSHQSLYTYNNLGNLLATTDARSNTTTYEYDDLGRVTKITDPLGNQTINTYSDANLVQIEEGKTTTESGRITIIEYDGLNRRTAVKKLDDSQVEVILLTYTYNSEGQIINQTDGNSNTTTNTHDELGRLISVADPSGFTSSYVYDKNGNVIQIIDAESNDTFNYYDYANRLTEVTNALNHTTSYTYNALSKILTVTDAKFHTTNHIYDDAGRLIEVSDHNGYTTQYAYDDNSNLIEKIVPNEYSDPGGADPIIYTYNEYNQLTQIDYPDGKTVTFSYDDVGNQTSWNNGILSRSIIYDELNQPTDVTTNYPSFSKMVSYTHNRFGQKDTMTDGEGQVTTYNYNDLGRLTSINHPSSLITEYEYDTTGRLTEKTLPNGVVTTYTYDISSRLTDMVNTAPGNVTISSYGYTHDDVGNRLSMTTLTGTHHYDYDDIYQLTSATHPSQPAETYTYDPVGNRKTSADHDGWDYDNSNRLLSYGNTTFTYDDNGNTTSKTDPNGITTYAYGYDNRMVGADTPDHQVSYNYDPLGVRLATTVDSNTIWYLYDNEDIIAEYDPTGVLISMYYHGHGIDEPVTMIRGGNTYYYTFDGLGSVSELTDNGGIMVETYSYNAFGNTTTSLATRNLYMYTSREYEVELGLHFNRARFYAPGTGRFYSEDPEGLKEGPNLYLYVFNNPIMSSDPTGRKAWQWLHCPYSLWKMRNACKDSPSIYEQVIKKADELADKWIEEIYNAGMCGRDPSIPWSISIARLEALHSDEFGRWLGNMGNCGKHFATAIVACGKSILILF